MHTLIVSCTFPPEPLVSGQTSVQIAEGLASKGHEVTVVTGFPNRPGGKLYPGYRRQCTKREKANGYELIRCFSFFSVKSSLISRLMENLSFGLSAGFVVLTMSRRPDLIYANTWPLIATGIMSAVSRLRRIPIIISVQDVYPESLISQGRISAGHPITRCIHWIDAMIARRANQVIVISETFADMYRRQRGLDPRKLRVIPNWADAGLVTPNDSQSEMFRAEKKIPRNAFVLLYGGNVGAAADVETLIRTFDKLKDIEDLYLVIAGEGSSLLSCQKLANELGCSRVLFHNPWKKEETSMVLAAAELLLLPTRGFQSTVSVPSKLISYMLAARPIIVSALPDSELAKVIESSQAGWVVEPDRPDLLAERIRTAIAMNRVELMRTGELGRRFALSNFVRETCLPKIIDLLETVATTQDRLCEGKTAHQARSL